jgi:hypothetical protein
MEIFGKNERRLYMVYYRLEEGGVYIDENLVKIKSALSW